MEELLTGFILRTTPYKENDIIVSILTKQGIRSFKARGIAKSESKLRSSLQLYSFGEYTCNSRLEMGHQTLTAAQLVMAPTEAMASIELSALLALFSEAVTKMEYDDWSMIYDNFDRFYRHLLLHRDYDTAYLVLLAHLVDWSGLGFEVDQCVNCGETRNIVALSASDGGLLCSRCNTELHYPIAEPDYIKLCRYVMKAPIDKFHLFKSAPHYTHRLAAILFDHLEQEGGLKLKARDVLMSIL